MGEGFNVVVGEVRAHATTVTTIASQVRSASGGAQDSVGGGAFGEIGEFFASAITQACDVLRQVTDQASQTVDQVQSGLSQIADAYQAVDENHASLFDKAVPAAAGAADGASTGGVA
jgi:methyl-accepting chemotaxis protein